MENYFDEEESAERWVKAGRPHCYKRIHIYKSEMIWVFLDVDIAYSGMRMTAIYNNPYTKEDVVVVKYGKDYLIVQVLGAHFCVVDYYFSDGDPILFKACPNQGRNYASY